MPSKILKTISLLLLQALVLEQVAFANPDLKAIKVDLFAKPKIDLGIPESVAVIEDSSTSLRSARNDKIIYLIQDAHTNTSGQFNLSKTLDLLLQKKPKINHVFVEAGLGDNSLSFYRKHGTPEQRKRLAEPFLRSGELHGEEYLDLTSNRDFTIWGVEDMELYKKALQDYREVSGQREKFEAYLGRIQGTLATLKPRIYNPDLLAFDEKSTKYKNDQMSLTDYFEILKSNAKRLDVDLGSYPDLQVLSRLKEQESKIDFAKANREQVQAMQALSQEDQKEIDELVSGRRNPSKLSGQDHKEEKAFYALLEEKLSRGDKYPELLKYFAYLKAVKTANPEGILEELKALENAIFSDHTRTPDETMLRRCQEMNYLLGKLLKMSLTPDEYADYQKLTRDFDVAHLTGFLNKKIMDLKDHYDRAVFLEEGFGPIVQRAENFYQLTYARDVHFIDQSLKKMGEEGEAVLITGGFHTANLKSLLKEKNISYVSLTPQVLHETNQVRYEKILLGQKGVLNQNALTTPGVHTLRTLEWMTMSASPALEPLKAGIVSLPTPNVIPIEAKNVIPNLPKASEGSNTPPATAAARLASQGPDARAWLEKTIIELNNSDNPERWLFLIDGGEIIQLLQHRNGNERELAIEYLGSNVTAIPYLIHALADQVQRVRSRASQLLAVIGEPAVPDLIRASQNDNKLMRLTAVNTLGLIHSPDIVVPLTEALNDKDVDVRHAAAERLYDISRARSLILRYELRQTVPYLADLLDSDDSYLVLVGAQALNQISQLDPEALIIVAIDILPQLINALTVVNLDKKSVWPTQVEIISALGQMGPRAKQALPKLLDIFKKSSPKEGVAYQNIGYQQVNRSTEIAINRIMSKVDSSNTKTPVKLNKNLDRRLPRDLFGPVVMSEFDRLGIATTRQLIHTAPFQLREASVSEFNLSQIQDVLESSGLWMLGVRPPSELKIDVNVIISEDMQGLQLPDSILTELKSAGLKNIGDVVSFILVDDEILTLKEKELVKESLKKFGIDIDLGWLDSHPEFGWMRSKELVRRVDLFLKTVEIMIREYRLSKADLLKIAAQTRPIYNVAKKLIEGKKVKTRPHFLHFEGVGQSANQTDILNGVRAWVKLLDVDQEEVAKYYEKVWKLFRLAEFIENAPRGARLAATAVDSYANFYESIRQGTQNLTEITENDLSRSRLFLTPDGTLRPLEERRKNGTFGITEVYFLPISESQKRMVAFQEELRNRFGSAVYLVDAEKLHFTTQGLETLAMHQDRSKIGLEEDPYVSVRKRAREIQTPAIQMQVARVNWNPAIGIFWELRPYLEGNQADSIIERRKAWNLPQPRPPHVTAAYFARPFSSQELADLKAIIARYQTPGHFGDINVNKVQVIAYEDLSFNAGYRVLETVSFVGARLAEKDSHVSMVVRRGLIVEGSDITLDSSTPSANASVARNDMSAARLPGSTRDEEMAQFFVHVGVGLPKGFQGKLPLMQEDLSHVKIYSVQKNNSDNLLVVDTATGDQFDYDVSNQALVKLRQANKLDLTQATDLTEEAMRLHRANSVLTVSPAQATAKVVLVDSFSDGPNSAFYQNLILRFNQTLASGSQVVFVSQIEGRAEAIAGLARTLGVKNKNQFISMKAGDLATLKLPISYLLADTYLKQAKALFGEEEKYFSLQSPQEQDQIGVYALAPVGVLMDLISLDQWVQAADLYNRLSSSSITGAELETRFKSHGTLLIPFVSKLIGRLVAQVYIAERALGGSA